MEEWENETLVDRCFRNNFEDSVCTEQFYFQLIPLLFFWSTIGFQLGNIGKKSEGVNRNCTIYTFARTMCAFALIFTDLLRILWAIDENGLWNVSLVSSVYESLTLLLIIFMSVLYVKRGRRSNGYVQVTFLFLFLTNLAVTILHFVKRRGGNGGILHFIRVLLLLTVNALNLINDKRRNFLVEEKYSPEDNCSFFSRSFLSWVTPIVEIGRRRPITSEDVFPLSPRNRADVLLEKWEEVWEKQLKDWTFRRKDSPFDDSISPPSIVRSFCQIYVRSILSVIGLRFLSDSMQYFGPLLLMYLISFVSDTTAPVSYGMCLVCLMFFSSEIRSFINNYYVFTMTQNGTRFQSALNNTIYKKVLRLSPSARNERTVGEIVNLLTIDCERVYSFAIFAGEVLSCPFQIFLGMAFLVVMIGIPVIPGLIIMILFVPLNYYSAKFIKNYQMRMMKLKDERTKMNSEVLNGIKLIKLYAWEKAFEKRINEIRREEVRILNFMNLMNRSVEAANNSVPFVVTVVTFACFILYSDENILTPKIAFVCIAIINLIRLPMKLFGMLINNFIQASVSLERLQQFLLAEEMDERVVEPADDGFDLQIENASFNWKGYRFPADIADLSLDVRMGEYVCIVGSVGSGKSSVLDAILGEMYCIGGRVRYSRKIGYVPQQPWLLNATVRQNIIFGKEFDFVLYQKVIDASELANDMKSMLHGDLTVVGENGITLSGGQKARVGIARALYQECDIYLLDDCLSAVDAHVGAAVFAKAFSDDGILKNKTKILVTHALRYTRCSSNIIVMRDGMIAEMGEYEELLNGNGIFAEMIREHEGEKEEEVEEDEEEESGDEFIEKGEVSMYRQESVLSRRSEKEELVERKVPEESDSKLIQPERVETGRVQFSVYLTYMKALSIKWSFWFLTFCVLQILLSILRSLWMSDWSNEHDSPNKESPIRRLTVFAGLGVGEVATLLVSQLFLVKGCQRASYHLHGPLLHSVLRSPISFFDTTPIGRILSRMSRDLDVIDSQMPVTIGNFVNCAMQVLLIVFLISFSTPLFIVAIFPLSIFYYFIMRSFIPTVRQMRRLISVTRSPILSTLGESIQGSSSIRAYKKVESSSTHFATISDQFIKCRYLINTTNRWLSLRLELLGNLVIMFAGASAVISTRYSDISPGIVGLSISYALSISEMMYLCVRMLTELETNIVAVERVEEYSNLEQESDWQSANPPPADWPTNGEIKWDGFSTRYRPSLPLVLRNLSASTRAFEKVGVVGRTGSGKSSLTLALYRLVEPSEGTIYIDGIDISKIGLHELRSKLSIIPQEPILFSGSLRFNLDPFEEHSDEELWRALDGCQLKEFVSSQIGQLGYQIAEGGKNMSVGQRQLVCLGRALLKGGKILILDEATAACDVQTDGIVQNMIRSKFNESTVIAIAHRLNTVANYDRILVMEKGNIAEFDSPQSLLDDLNSKYSRMVEKAKEHS